MRYAALIGVLAVWACASAPPQWSPADRVSAASCADSGSAAAAPWQLATGQGFTFCVPPGWRSTDGRTWHLGASVVGWCLRDHWDQCPNVEGHFRMYISSPGELAPRLAEEGNACGWDQNPASIDGSLATLIDQHCDAHHVVVVRFQYVPLGFVGQTDDAVVARLLLQVYRTVRFTHGLEH